MSAHMNAVDTAVVKIQNAQDAFAGVQYPSPSLEAMVRDINRLLISLSAKRTEHLYQMLDALDAERDQAVQVNVGKYKDKTVFWISMATCGLQGLNVLAIAAPQALPGINNFFGNVINLNRFREVNDLGVRVFNYSKIADAADKILQVPAGFMNPFKDLFSQSQQGDRTEAQSAVERVKELAGQRRQEVNQAISSEEEAFRTARERQRQEEQAREAMVK